MVLGLQEDDCRFRRIVYVRSASRRPVCSSAASKKYGFHSRDCVDLSARHRRHDINLLSGQYGVAKAVAVFRTREIGGSRIRLSSLTRTTSSIQCVELS